MPDLVALAYPDVSRAAEVLATLKRLRTGAFAEVGDAVSVIRRTDWTVLLSREIDLSATDDCCLRFWRGLISSLILTPGLAYLHAAIHDYGMEPEFARRLGGALPPGSSAVLLILDPEVESRLSADIRSLGGTMCATPLACACNHEAAALASPTPARSRRQSGRTIDDHPDVKEPSRT